MYVCMNTSKCVNVVCRFVVPYHVVVQCGVVWRHVWSNVLVWWDKVYGAVCRGMAGYRIVSHNTEYRGEVYGAVSRGVRCGSVV